MQYFTSDSQTGDKEGCGEGDSPGVVLARQLQEQVVNWMVRLVPLKYVQVREEVLSVGQMRVFVRNDGQRD